jgi:hypothetical protein
MKDQPECRARIASPSFQPTLLKTREHITDKKGYYMMHIVPLLAAGNSNTGEQIGILQQYEHFA